MTVFHTPEPISVSLEFGVGELRLVASNSTETVVEVKPTDPDDSRDVSAAEQTQVEYSSNSLVVRGPKRWRQWTPRGGRQSIDVEIHLPEASRVNADLGMASVRGEGPLGEVDAKTGAGDVRLDEAAAVRVRTGVGEVTIGRVHGDADVKTGSGRVDIGRVGGSATVKNSNGDTRIGEVSGRAQMQNANGAIHLDMAGSDVTAKTAYGDLCLATVSRGGAEAKTGYGQIEVGVLEGVAAWLDLSTGFGRVDNELEDTRRPSAEDRTVEIRAHTAMGDVSVHRVSAPAGLSAPGRSGRPHRRAPWWPDPSL